KSACGGDEALRREVENLLAYQRKASQFMDTPALDVAARMLARNKDRELVGNQLGPYEVLSLLGRGGMGEVYLARDTRLDRKVAFKVLPAELKDGPERMKRFVQEAKAASRLNHPNIITIHDIGQADGLDYIAMEYVAGKTLDELIPRKGIPLKVALPIAIQIAEALAAAHAAGIVHRDLKPGNVMVAEGGKVKVLDFGLAKLTERSKAFELELTETIQTESQSLTEEGMIVGTVAYMSPEQAEGKKLDARSDIFSFGSLLYEMFTGRKAFQGESNIETLSAILREEPDPVGQIVQGLPPEMERIINRCLRKDRERRWQSVADVKVALQELKEESESGRMATAETPQHKRRLGLIWTAGLLVFAIIVAATLWFVRPGSKPPTHSMAAIPFTTDPGWEMAPSFSPDGNQVVYVADGGMADWGIYIKRIGSGSPLRRTKSPSVEISPVWSPDGDSIAFLRGLGSNKAAVLMMPTLNGPERKLAEISIPFDLLGFRHGSILRWLRGGKWLVTSDKGPADGSISLIRVSVDTEEKHKLTTPPAGWVGDFNPALSPDGHSLAFARFSASQTSEIYVLPISNSLSPDGQPRRLTFDGQLDSMPAWTADGREIVFVRGTNHIYGLWRINAFEPGTPEPMPFAGEGAISPSISRQGNRLVYVQWSFDTDIWRVDVSDSQEKASAPMKLISSTRTDHEGKFSPDGKRIAFVSYRSGNSEVWVCGSDGSNPVAVTSMNGPLISELNWTPDSQRISFSAVEKESTFFYIVGAQGGRPVLFSEGSDPNWSWDGQWIYFSSRRSGQAQIWKMPVRGGNTLQVTHKGGVSPLESKDGKTLFYWKGDSLWNVPTQGGEESKVLDLVYQDCFAVGHNGIFFIPEPLETDTLSIIHSGHLSIQYYDFASGKTRRILDLPKDRYIGYGFDISPDERSILFTLDSGSIGSDLMLVENFK
ncbi:MAG TPA: protein kinase, partial [Terriglobia bacterium]|nr:protein kinase [Terriglobia bacterium]